MPSVRLVGTVRHHPQRRRNRRTAVQGRPARRPESASRGGQFPTAAHDDLPGPRPPHRRRRIAEREMSTTAGTAAPAHCAGQPRRKTETPPARRLVPSRPPVPVAAGTKDPQWPARWPHMAYLELGAIDTTPGTARAELDVLLATWGL